jgi:uncharacterized protein (DUF1800 family)
MSLNRRQFLQLAGLAAGSAALSGCAPLYTRLAGGPVSLTAWPDWRDEPAYPLLRRVTFGPTLAERAAVAEMGFAAWLEEQLAYEQVEDRAAALRLRPYDLVKQDADYLRIWEPEEVQRPLQQATLLRRIYSRRQVYEMMVHFWSDHFNIAITKEKVWALKPVDDQQVIRPHALGNFADLLHASATSPAMLTYLDNQANVKAWPNENYAREVMELHTLGVDSGYTQADVMELARMLTGWSVTTRGRWGEFTFDAATHDTAVKQWLGQTIAPAGQAEGEAALYTLATQAQTGRYLATKLARRFICDEPERDAPELIEKTAVAFTRTGGDIRAMVRVLLLDGLAAWPAPLPRKFKRPVDFVTSALRQLPVETDGGKPLLEELAAMGQADFTWPTPDGPPDVADAWQRNLLPRWRFADRLAHNEYRGARWHGSDELLADLSSPAELLDQLSYLLLGGALPPADSQPMLTALTPAPTTDLTQAMPLLLAGLLASPAFQWR